MASTQTLSSSGSETGLPRADERRRGQSRRFGPSRLAGRSAMRVRRIGDDQDTTGRGGRRFRLEDGVGLNERRVDLAAVATCERQVDQVGRRARDAPEAGKQAVDTRDRTPARQPDISLVRQRRGEEPRDPPGDRPRRRTATRRRSPRPRRREERRKTVGARRTGSGSAPARSQSARRRAARRSCRPARRWAGQSPRRTAGRWCAR